MCLEGRERLRVAEARAPLHLLLDLTIVYFSLGIELRDGSPNEKGIH